MVQTKHSIDEGTESTVTLVVDDGVRTVIKTKQPQGITQYPFEAYAYRALKALGSHVPTVISVSDTELTMSALEGETLDDKTELYGDATLFDAVARDLVLNRQVVFKGYGKATLQGADYVGEFETWSAYLESVYALIKTSPHFSDDQKRRLQEKWSAGISAISLDKGMLVHGDFALSALFVNENKYEGIIDYGDAFIGDPLMDLSYFRFKEITKEYGASIYALLADSYARASGIDRSVIDAVTSFYMLYWGIIRTSAQNIEPTIVGKFVEKTLVALDTL